MHKQRQKDRGLGMGRKQWAARPQSGSLNPIPRMLSGPHSLLAIENARDEDRSGHESARALELGTPGAAAEGYRRVRDILICGGKCSWGSV